MQLAQIILMILRSQNQREPYPTAKPEPISIRDIMRENDLSAHEDNTNSNNILPPSLTNPYYQPPSILKNILDTNVPPSHIQSESSIQLPDLSEQVRSRTPRRKKIFQNKPKNNPKSQFGQISPSNAMNISQPPSSFGTTPQFTRLQSTPPAPLRKEQPFKAYESFSSPGQNSSGTVYNTIPSMKKTTDNKNNTIYEEMNSNFGLQPSGISLRSKNSVNQSSDMRRIDSSKREVFNQPGGQLNRLSRNVTLNPPVPVYENKFYKNDKPKGEQVLHNLFERIPIENTPPAYEPHYTNIPQQNHLLDGLLKDYRQFEAKNAPQPRYPSFGSIPNDRPINPTQPILTHSTRPPYTPYDRNPPPALVAMSPFEQNRREELQSIPKRFEEIENKVKQHETELIHLNQKLAEVQLNDLQSQKALLNELIKKQEELNLKQRQLNSNLEQITKMQIDSNLKKQQILKYELEIQQARRMEDLHKENERLYHELIRKDPKNYNQNENNQQKRSFVRSAYPIIIPERDDQNFHKLLSPFAIKPEHY